MSAVKKGACQPRQKETMKNGATEPAKSCFLMKPPWARAPKIDHVWHDDYKTDGRYWARTKVASWWNPHEHGHPKSWRLSVTKWSGCNAQPSRFIREWNADGCCYSVEANLCCLISYKHSGLPKNSCEDISKMCVSQENSNDHWKTWSSEYVTHTRFFLNYPSHWNSK